MDLQYALTLVRQNGNRIQLVPEDMRTEEVRHAAITRTPTAIEHLTNVTVEEQEHAIKIQGIIDRDGIFELVAMIPNIDPVVLDKAIDVNGNVVQLFDNPTPGQMLRAVTKDGDAIRHLKDPEHCLQVIAIQHDHKNIQYVAEPTYEVVEMMLLQNYRSAEFVQNLHRDHQELVLKRLPDDGLHYLNNIDEDIALRYITDNPEKIQMMRHQTEECCWAALNADGRLIKSIRNPTPEMESYAKLVSDGN